MPNRLQHESSLYLRQHADNPVDWFPWGPEALALAKQLDRPIFLSIGYSACHWCHVMAHESFEDAAVGRLLNEHFVNIKVDREERPDLDQIYMAAVQALNQGQGGWPMSVFLTPDLHPFFAGTYYPPESNYGRPGFKLLVTRIAEAWRDRRADVANHGLQIAQVIRAHEQSAPQPGQIDASILDAAMLNFRRAFEPVHGGLGHAPKFPRPIDLRLMLRIHKRTGQGEALSMALLTLDKMARGGMYDQLIGGFHRYSTDPKWLVPHFEKMLYDNALLPPAYLEAWQITGDPFYRQIVEETLDWVLKEMTSPAGGFFSTLDADSEGEEGKFYVWTEPEIVSVLGSKAAEAFCYVYDVSPGGNWEGHNILNCPKPLDQCAQMLKRGLAELRAELNDSRRKLYEVRARRVWPGRDEKVLTAWNAIMISAFAQAGAVFEVPRYLEAAEKAADFVLSRLRTPDGRLLRTCGVNTPAKLNGYLEDYAYLCDALVTLYESTFRERWLSEATSIAEIMVAHFADEQEGGFFNTSDDHEALIVRCKEFTDGSTPSGNGVAVMALLRLAALTMREDFRKLATGILTAYAGKLHEAPLACGQMLLAMDFHLGPASEIAVVGDASHPESQRVLRALRRAFRPNSVLAFSDAGVPSTVRLTAAKAALGPVTTYVCQNFACQKPIVGADGVEAMYPAKK